MTDPDTPETGTHETGDEARAGETSGHMRYVLLISILLAIGILSAIVWVPLLFHK
ncbi:hypothetical protein [Sphingomonas panacisoli]|uniref:hypothetical protein n=1 Tax=Sphingomonas panacisoli TaxID=1813879 RepID=UPI00164819F9|nr:hypothetical protein [Sphingomonas panacisoli]